MKVSISKKIFCVALVFVLALCLSVSAFADGIQPRASLPFSAFRAKNIGTSRMLNADSSASVISYTTNVTTYGNTEHITQAWLGLSLSGDRYLIATAATNASTADHNAMYVLNIVHSSQNCNLVRYGSLVQAGDQNDAKIYIANEGDDRRGIVAKDSSLGVLCLTDNGGNASWLAPNSQSTQIWNCIFAQL